MNQSLPSPLPRNDRRLMHVVCWLVPDGQRDEWTRAWAAELWCSRQTSRGVGTHSLFSGILQDALWLRSDQFRRVASGTAALCLLSLCFLVGVSTLPAMSHDGSWAGLGSWLMRQSLRFIGEATLITFVSYATTPFKIEERISRSNLWLKARLFRFAKNLLLLVLAFNLTADLSYPFRTLLPLTAEFLQNMSFALCAVFGLRWSLQDDVARCRQCLRTLTAPERVGRPSHNFLEWNGTELLCSRGHGLLSVPEIETSWCSASAWVTPHHS